MVNDDYLQHGCTGWLIYAIKNHKNHMLFTLFYFLLFLIFFHLLKSKQDTYNTKITKYLSKPFRLLESECAMNMVRLETSCKQLRCSINTNGGHK